MSRNIIQEKSFQFSLQSIEVYKQMTTQNEYSLSKQFIRSATSIGANVQEAGAAQSKKDFIAKMSIASKEAREVHYWIRLFQESKLFNIDLTKLEQQAMELIKLSTAIVKSAQENLNKH